MRRWGALLLSVASAIWVALHHSTTPKLLEDSDTRVLLEALEVRHSPLSWFGTDWPLQNHFYRPVSALSFELDRAAFGRDAAGFGWTNALIAALCVIVLYWLIFEVTRRPAAAAVGSICFAMWTTDTFSGSEFMYWLALLPILSAFLPGRKIWPAISSSAVIFFLATEVHRQYPLRASIIEWLPGRTASVMTLFALVGLAAYARSERLASEVVPRRPDPLEPPATRNTVLTKLRPQARWGWLSFSLGFVVLALGSYEQAVIIPALLLGVAVTLRLLRIRSVRWVHSVFWVALGGYLALRFSLLGLERSAYQAQQLRNGPDVYLTLLDYLVPVARPAWQTIQAWSGWETLLIASFWEQVAFVGSFLVSSSLVIRRLKSGDPFAVMALAGLLMSTLAFLPMAWLKHFDHYHYLPACFRALMVVGLLGLSWESLVSAMSLPNRQAPRRSDPAPGSLPRR